MNGRLLLVCLGLMSCLALQGGDTMAAEVNAPVSTLRIGTWTMPGAEVGPENPLPPLFDKGDAHKLAERPGIPEEIRPHITYGRVPNPLPYTMQDRYTRERHPMDFRVAILENEHLKATFLIGLGGRLWSLVDKDTGRELLDVNPVFQPANLAIRNAWFSGGVEWNIGTIGHTPFTCSPLFVGRVRMEDGTPVLRMYEWERIRRVPWQVDAWIPADSHVLFIRVRIVNPHDYEIPMYWWSNMAVPETEDSRVIVPATSSYKFGYGPDGLGLAPVPILDGMDITYTTNFDRAGDFFFRIPDGSRHWISTLDGKGMGLIQTSTPLLKGRKLFYWGRGPGGKRWQEFLSVPGHAYLETQAGLARTQLEHLPMPAKAEWEWLEAYGLMKADPKIVHGDDWAKVRAEVESHLDELIPREELNAKLKQSGSTAIHRMEAVYQAGSGWGALEAIRRQESGEEPFCTPALEFKEATLTEQQMPWLALLRDGAMPEADPDVEPLGYMVQDEWREMLEKALAEGRGDNWNAWMHLGVMRYYVDDRDGAREAWEKSLEKRETPWVLRNLAVLAKEDKDLDKAADLYARACKMRPQLLPLVAECGKALIQAEQYQEWLDMLAVLPENIRTTGRVRLLEGQAALGLDDFDRVAKLFEDKFTIDDNREGETSASNLWLELHEKQISQKEGIPINDALKERVLEEYPVPSWIDFRMSTKKKKK